MAAIETRFTASSFRPLGRVASSLGILALGMCGLSCGSGLREADIPVVTPDTMDNVLTAGDVQQIAVNAAASVNVPMVIAISDRRGVILAVYVQPGAPTTTTGNYGNIVPADEEAVSLARTAAFFSNDQAPLSSRTVRFISGIHFPPGVTDTEAAPLYGIEDTNRGCPFNTTFLPGQSLPPSGLLHNPSAPGLGIATGKANLLDSDPSALNAGGIPIYKNNRVAGGVGIVAVPTANYNDVVEYAGIAGTFGSGFVVTPAYPGVVVVGGVALPFVSQTTLPTGYTIGVANGTFTVGPNAGSGTAPEEDLILEHGSKFANGLTLAQVQQIVQQAVTTGNETRAAIRLPVGSRARFVIAVSDLDGTLLALYRMPDATIFSVDVAVAKSRNVVFYSAGSAQAAADMPGIPPLTAVTNRTLDYGGEPLFPEGIDGTARDRSIPLLLKDQANPCTQGSQPANANQSGIVFFPGSVPLYINGVLVGGLGISGDGVDQDDYAAAGGAAGYMPPVNIRADQIFIDGVRMAFQAFPENPTN